MNNKSKIIRISIILAIFAILAIGFGIFQYKSLAVATNEMVSIGIGDPPEFPYVRHQDLIEMYNILCCQRGTNLPSYSSTLVIQGDKSSSEPYLTLNDIGKKLFEESQDASGYTTDESFQNPYTGANSLTYGYYKKSDPINCSPAEAYILAEMSENTYENASDFYNITNKEYTGEVTDDITITIQGKTLYGIDLYEGDDGLVKAKNFVAEGEDGKYYYVEITGEADFFPYTYVQYAWWTTDAGGSTVVAPTSLQKEAEAFEAYINKVAKKDENGNIVTEQKTVTVDGKTVTVTAPVIDFVVTGEDEDAKAYYDGEVDKYLIGPFKVNYYEESVTSERGTINFSEIVNATLYSNLGEVPREEWAFVFPDRDSANSEDSESSEEDTSPYPHTGETFYIVLNYIEDMTQIEDINFEFQYMNAGGQYERLTGEYFKATWSAESEAIWCDEETSYCECGGTSSGPHRATYDDEGNFTGYACSGGAKKCSHGFYHTHIIRWNYWLELTDLDPQPSQTLAEGLVGVRWYEHEEFSLFFGDLPGDDDDDDDDDDEPKKVIKLTIPIEGEVWIDTEPDKKNDTTHGLKEDGEKPYEKAEVYVYKVYMDDSGNEVKRELATMFAEDNETKVEFPVYTDENGKYEVPNILVPGTDEEDEEKYTIKYDVVFMYDGQNYTATEFLPTGSGDPEKYISADTENRKKYEKDSMAVEKAEDRDNFNKKFTEIYGKEDMDDNGNTVGEAKGEDGTYELNYTSEEYKLSEEDGNSRRISTLTTRNDEGYIIDQYKMPASTGAAGLLYPFEDEISLETADDVEEISVKEEDNVTITTYRAIYDYMLHINLGLRERDEADLGVAKDLYKAQVVVNEKSLTYKYNTLYDFEDEANKELLDVQLEAAKAQPYTLGLYSSDYAYRSKVYETSADVVKDIKADTELRVFLTYKVIAYNESEGYDEVVNLLNDYYDSTFTVVSEDIRANVLNDEGIREEQTIAEDTYYRVLPPMEAAKYYYNSSEDVANYPSGTISWKEESGFNESSDYKKMSTDSLKNLKLKAGERVEIFVTFEVDSEGFLDKDSTDRPNLLGEKNNIAEIANYSTYNQDGSIAGRIDKDSAPDNIDFDKNEKSWYEDDTESAPAINIELYNTNREINGLVWEDAETKDLKYDQKVGNGTYDSDEKGISNIDVELIEKIVIDDIEYEYLWPADAFDGTVAEEGYNSTDVTEDGKYDLKGFVAGNYVVRFKYGNKEENIEYNGQDYKNTAYQVGMKNENGESTLNNEWHDLKDETLANSRVSDARDYELQRMKVVAYSREISNPVGTVLETADNSGVNHDELIKNTQMVANTAKLNLEIERQDYIDYGTEKIVDGIPEYTYSVGNIDFGLEKRSETVFDLTKNLSEITLYKENGTEEILKAVINDDGTFDMTASDELTQMIRVPKTDSEQGFSYINMDDEYMKDLTIKLKYKITVVNNSEVDWTGLLADFNDATTAKEEILAEVEMLEEQEDYVSGKGIVYGDYVGLNYYTNENHDTDKIVTTKVEKLIDYVDTNTSIDSSSTNGNSNASWVNISTDELKNGNLLADSVYTTLEDGNKVIQDDKGNVFDTESRKNIYVTDNEIFNPSMIADLVPEKAKETGDATSGEISLTTSVTTTSEESTDDLLFNNLSEILVYSNTVGRRDSQAVPGNAEIARGEFTAATGYSEDDGSIITDYAGAKEVEQNGTEYHLNGERDTDAAEFVTFTNPTGYTGESVFESNIEYLIAIAIGCIILATGIVIIKLKVVDADTGIKVKRNNKKNIKK